jgi:hypothetical protein
MKIQESIGGEVLIRSAGDAAVVWKSICRNFEILGDGERRIDEFLNLNDTTPDGGERKFTYDEEGIGQRWCWLEHFSSDLLAFLRMEYPRASQLSCECLVDLVTCPLKEKIEALRNSYACYRHIISQQAASNKG